MKYNPEILFEDNHFLIVNKKTGELVQGDKTGDEPLLDKLKSFIKERDQKPGNVYLGAPHRLDRPVSGAVVFCKTGKGLTRMNELFRKKEVEKIYWAIVKNLPPENEGRLENHLWKDEGKNKSFVSPKPTAKTKMAVLNYRLIASSDHYHLLEIRLETGRHHQIRAQLAAMGCPIKGDLKYGFERSNPDAGISLHARFLRFEHPVKKESVHISAPVPADALWGHFLRLAE